MVIFSFSENLLLLFLPHGFLLSLRTGALLACQYTILDQAANVYHTEDHQNKHEEIYQELPVACFYIARLIILRLKISIIFASFELFNIFDLVLLDKFFSLNLRKWDNCGCEAHNQD